MNTFCLAGVRRVRAKYVLVTCTSNGADPTRISPGNQILGGRGGGVPFLRKTSNFLE